MVIAGAPALSAQEAVYIVRHAERADQSSDSPLSAAGRRRAVALARLLHDAGITHIYTSEKLRTLQTAAPFAAASHVRPRQRPAAEGSALIRDLAELGAHDRALVVGHSNTVPELLRGLGVPTPVTIGDADFDNLFIVVPQKAGPPVLLRLKY
jgi:broad specificity phosphatase PhoE